MAVTNNHWFVAPDTKGGNGSRERPFHDLWVALRQAGPGDVIHIAAGTYFGRYDRSSWIVNSPSLAILGGYSTDFSRRAPWQTPTILAAFPGYEYVRENNFIAGTDDHSGLVLDGLFFDAAGRNTYGDKPVEGIRSYPNMDGAIASFNAQDVTIRNCVFSNSANGGVELAGEGSRFENNLVINTIGTAMLNLRSAGAGDNKKPITVTNNVFCFAHDTGPPCGTGGDRAIGVRISCAAVVQENLFVSCGNAAIGVYRDLERISVDRNVFFVTPRDVINSRANGNNGDITESNLDELEDLGFKSASGNVVQNPGMSGFRRDWLDAYSRHLLGNYVKPPFESANALRTAAGLPPLSPSDLEMQENKGDFAPRLSVADALALRFAARQNFPPDELASEIGDNPARATLTYRSVDWSVIETPDAALANQRVELRAGLGFEQNTSLLADAPPETHMGIRIYRPLSDDASVFVLARRYTLPARQFDEAVKYNTGREVESTYLLRGVYRTDIDSSYSRQNATLVVESMVPAPLLPVNLPTRLEGRDWFVRAGASGGDGTREKPFRDPFQALDKAEGGDAVHVAGGDYFGKLHSGKWKLLVRNLTLLGGYNSDFRERDPWQNATRFVLTGEERAKGIPDGMILASEENSDGLILDGFIFDGSSYNAYSADGSLDLRSSPSSPLVMLRGGDRGPITVRNCLFINAGWSAISVSGPCGVFENNVLVNSSGWALSVRADGPGPWTIRNNTMLFACDPTERAGTGESSSEGTLFHLTGRAVSAVDSNIFAFADNFGVRFTIRQQNVSFEKNVFAGNLFNHLSDAQYLWVDGSTWERRAVADTEFAAFLDNKLELPKLPVDPGFADTALARLFALPSRISNEQWRTLAAQIGSSATPVAAASAAPVTPLPKPAAGTKSALDDLLASLNSIDARVKEHEAARAPVAPLYCPVFEWKKALPFWQEPHTDEPGAHKVKLAVSFAPICERVAIQYTLVSPEAIESNHGSLDSKPVELEVTGARSCSGNTSVLPNGANADDFAAYYVSTPGDAIRTRLAILVRLDTAASKVLNSANGADRLRIRGIARLPHDPGGMSIMVDSAEAVES